MTETTSSTALKYEDRALAILEIFQTAAEGLPADNPRKQTYIFAMGYLLEIAKSIDNFEHDINDPEFRGTGHQKIKYLRFNYNMIDRARHGILYDIQSEEIEMGGKEFLALEEEMAPKVRRILLDSMPKAPNPWETYSPFY
ncbi:uncharacterized protein LAJ45_01066 [Morchella importuna]|uniref:uncharacterized protein n=1 Tax=Morchella importuna TaxID=1174673 RepID=UPI001E8DA83C|nr:uncharacterized protein LAJ45_01066 [Morchella importuna]KAH8154538.1 hypothetical protein LAJ45_01066 [Morchella importuna]